MPSVDPERLRRALGDGRVEILRAAGGLAGGSDCGLVGGAVRDLLLDRPVKELDLVVAGEAAALASALAGALGGSVRAHDRFGTARVELPDGEGLDVASARRERYPFPGGLPEVFPSGLDEDLGRRDFTINAMAMRIDPARFGELADPRGGVRDLRAGLVRTLHPRSFHDDPTRALRAVRLAARLGFAIEAGTRAALAEAIADGAFGKVSGQRLRRELVKLLEERTLSGAGALLESEGLVEAIFGGGDDWDPERGVPAERLLESLDGTLRGLERLRDPEVGEGPDRLALFLFGLAGADGEGAARMAGRLALGEGPGTALAALPGRARRRAGRLRRAGARRSGIRAALAGAGPEELVAAAALEPETAGPIALDLSELRAVRPSLRAADLLALGVPEGPLVGEILERLTAARLDGEAGDAQDERRLVRERLAAGPGAAKGAGRGRRRPRR